MDVFRSRTFSLSRPGHYQPDNLSGVRFSHRPITLLYSTNCSPSMLIEHWPCTHTHTQASDFIAYLRTDLIRLELSAGAGKPPNDGHFGTK